MLPGDGRVPSGCDRGPAGGSRPRSPVPEGGVVMTAPLLELSGVDVVLGQRSRATRILSGISLTVEPGQIVGVIGETGSGKTTLARTIVGLINPVAGEVRHRGARALAGKGKQRRLARREGRVQFV